MDTMDNENHFSSFFMLVLSASGLVIILSQFISGNFTYKARAFLLPNPSKVPVEAAPVPMEGNYMPADDGFYVDEMEVYEEDFGIEDPDLDVMYEVPVDFSEDAPLQ